MHFPTAHVQNPGSEDPRAHRRQPADHHPLSDAPAGPQDLSIFDVNVHKMADKNKVSGHIAPHSVAVSMQGPGTVSLSTTEQVVGPSEAKPDHTVSMVKDTGGCNGPECSMVNVKSGKPKNTFSHLVPNVDTPAFFLVLITCTRIRAQCPCPGTRS